MKKYILVVGSTNSSNFTVTVIDSPEGMSSVVIDVSLTGKPFSMTENTASVTFPVLVPAFSRLISSETVSPTAGLSGVIFTEFILNEAWSNSKRYEDLAVSGPSVEGSNAWTPLSVSPPPSIDHPAESLPSTHMYNRTFGPMLVLSRTKSDGHKSTQSPDNT